MATVLIVEDGVALRVLLADAVRRAGYSVLEAGDAGGALAAIQRERPDAVVLDIHLPGADGLTVLRRVRGDPGVRSTPFVILSNDASKESIVEVARLGISGYVLKSKFTLESLLEPIAKACGARGAGGGTGEAGAGAAEQRDTGAAVDPKVTSEVAAQAAATSTGAAPIGGPIPMPEAKGPAEDLGAALRELKPLISRSEVLERVGRCEQLRAFSPTVSQLLSMTTDPETSMSRVVKAIAQDHAVALKILKLANSVVYTRGEPVTSVKNAVMRIGMENIRQAVLNLSVMDHFAASPGGEQLNLAQFWEHAISTGLIAAEITHVRDPAAAESAFTGGLLHDVGRLVYMEQLADVYPAVLRTARELELPLEQVESRLLLLNHADVMDKVLHSWKFPKELINPLVFHHLSAGNIRQVAVNQLEGVATMSLANRLSHALLLGSSGNLTVYPVDDLCRLLRLDPAVVLSLEQTIPGQTADMKLAMLARGSGPAWTPVREECQKQLERPFRPLFVSADPDFDAYRLLCRTLGTGEGEPECPNVAVVHVQHGRDRVPLTSRLKQAEAEAGCGRLPLIVLSPSGKLTLEDGFMATSSAQHLATPVVLSRFLRAVNAATAASAAAAPGALKAAA